MTLHLNVFFKNLGDTEVHTIFNPYSANAYYNFYFLMATPI